VRDYIYIPLGGNRKGKVRQAVNLVAAMTAMGFWHGSASHYIFWGVLHGTALGITEFFPKLRDIILSTLPGRLFSWLATFIFVIFSWIFFRVESVSDGFAMIGQLFSFQRLDESFKLYVLIAIIIGFIFLAFEQRIIRAVSGFQQKMPRAVWIAFVTVAVALLFRVGSDTLPAFIYFNF
jgi:D-alanyl-lipoteichoic acid acyltransferase DltB (MBOAT superfamily)